ncbi:hypothetical protein D3C73_611310 [compost metagenome]
MVLHAFLGREDRVTDLVGNLRVLRVRYEGCSDGCVDPHAALALLEQRQVFVEAVGRSTGWAGFLHQVGIELQRCLPFRLIELGLPVLVEPAAAEGVVERRHEGHVFAPAGFAAKAHARDVVAAIGDLLRRIGDEFPGRAFRHLEAGLFEQVLAVHDHGGFAVERSRVKLAVDGQTAADRRQKVVHVILVAEAVERQEPLLLGPDRNFVVADGDDVVLTAVCGDVGGDAFAKNVFLERDPVYLDVRVRLGELRGQALHADHVAVVDGCDCEGFSRCGGGNKSHGRAGAQQKSLQCHIFLPRR